MKRLIRRLALILASVLVFSLVSCSGPYVSSYSALGFVRGNDNNHCNASFMLLNGTYVFKLKKNEGADGDLSYKASLEEGEMTVYYDSLGTKEPLFTVKSGESVESRGGYVDQGSMVYVIIEAKDAKGSLEVRLSNQ